MNQLTSINNELSNSLTESSTMSMGVWKRFCRHPGAIFGMIVLSILLVMALAAPLSPYDPEASEMTARYEAPSASHIMGTDALGRDLFTRILYGGRVSLTVGVLVVVLSIFIGVPVGALAGYYGGTVDSVLMRITDAFLSLPSFLVLILLSAILLEVKIPYLEGNSVLTISFVIGVFSWTTFARLVRAAFLGIRETEFVAASRALGGSDMRIMTRHILPNAIGPIIVEATLEFGYAIIEESGLSFLGFGIQPPTPSWGNLLSNAQDYFVKYPWLAIFPGLMIFLSIISINYIGDGLRDAFDPNKVLSKVGEV
ncbi:MAG: ABC transporter permease [Chloroflexi bacterium]|nr:ABC transporter permease [Chloroflexota bacterium]